MLRSLLSGLSGLQSHQLQIDVIGNNIANLNTVGFKSNRVTFQELLSQTLRGASRPTATNGGTNPMQVGLGTSVGTVDTLFGQGELLTTGQTTDLAIEGDGFFYLAAGSLVGYTRAGSFSIGADGRLLASNGYVLQGRMAAADGTIATGTPVTDITLPLGRVSPAHATTRMTLEGNLDASQSPQGTILHSRRLLALAQGTDAVTSLYDPDGVAAGASAGSTLTVVANATGSTLVTNLSNANGLALDLTDGQTLTVLDGTTVGSMVFDASWTWDDFAQNLQATLAAMGTETDVTVTVETDGSLRFTNPVGGTGQNLTITVQGAGTPEFNQLVNNVLVVNGGTPVNSSRAYFREELVEGTHFSTLAELAVDLETSLQKVSAGTTVSFDRGVFTFNNSGPSDIHDLSLVQEGTGPGTGTAFEQALGIAQVDLAAGGTLNSGPYLDLAQDTDRLADLRNAAGVSLGLSTGSLVEVRGAIGGTALAPVTLQVVSGGDGSGTDRQAETLAGLCEELADVFGITSSGSVSMDSSGFLVIGGNPGEASALSGVSLTEAGIGSPALTEAFRFAETQAAADVTHATSLTAYDSLGNTHVVTITFTKDPFTVNEWAWEATVDGTATALAGDQGTASFAEDGTLLSFTSTDGSFFSFDPGNGAANPVEIALDAGTPGAPGGLCQYAFDSTAAIDSQDGYGMGYLDSLSIGSDGTISGVFTNGVTHALARIVLADFNNPGGMLRGQDGMYSPTDAAGTAVVGDAGADMGRTISSGTLEASNVDLANELATMILAQRGFQANARTITASDQMLNEVINMTR